MVVIFVFGRVLNCITMLLCGIYNITLLSCTFGNRMVQHNDGLIHKELSNAWSCMTDDKFCVFWSEAKQRREMKFGRREDQQNGKKTTRLESKSCPKLWQMQHHVEHTQMHRPIGIVFLLFSSLGHLLIVNVLVCVELLIMAQLQVL
jgi:hypothetical protein